nr:TrkA C-terminal domain-containing protein [Microcystis sp. M_QC_C_20170808_M2Col]
MRFGNRRPFYGGEDVNTLTARELSPQLYIIARGEYPSTEKKLKLAGADQVVLPATIGAERMAHLITHPAAIDFLQEDEGRRNLNELLADIDLQFEEYSILSDSPFLGQPISQMEVRGQGAFIIVAVRQFDGRVIAHPDNSTILQQGDTVILWFFVTWYGSIGGHKSTKSLSGKRFN